MFDIPSVEDTINITINSYDNDELESYVKAIVHKIKSAARRGLFSVEIKYAEIVDNVSYYDDYFTNNCRLNEYGRSLFHYIISYFIGQGYEYSCLPYPNDIGFTISWYI